MQPVSITAKDGYALAARYFASAEPAQGAVLIAPAMGVKQGYYSPFAEYLAESGFAAMTLDYRGIGASAPRSLRGFKAKLVDWADLDLAAAAEWLSRRHAGKPLLWLGHSVGGQLLGLVESVDVTAALFVGAQMGYWGNWPGTKAALMLGFWYGLLPASVAIAGRLPFRTFGMGEDVPAGVAREWSSWGKHRDYILLEAKRRGGANFARYRGALRLIAVSDDGYAPPRSVEALARAYSATSAEVQVLHPSEVGEKRLGHFAFFRKQYRETLWTRALDYLRVNSSARGPGTTAAIGR